MRYHAPLSIDLSAKQRVKVFRDRLMASKMRHALWAARKYATRLMRIQGINLVARSGGEEAIAATMSIYTVNPALYCFAAREVVRLLEVKGRA